MKARTRRRLIAVKWLTVGALGLGPLAGQWWDDELHRKGLYRR